MSARTGIEYCDSTWSAWIGCTKVSPACDHCYAEGLNKRFHAGANWGPGAPRRVLSDANWRIPGSWHRNSAAFEAVHGRRRRVFLNNQADIFDNEVDEALRAAALQVVEETVDIDWLMLTKRVGNARRMVPSSWVSSSGGWPKHVRLGITACNHEEAQRELPKLFDLGCPNYVSIEPMLGYMDLAGAGLIARLQWVILGGESGPGSRPMNPTWARKVRDDCLGADVPFFFKQWGSFDREGYLVGKKRAGRELDGVVHEAYPASSEREESIEVAL